MSGTSLRNLKPYKVGDREGLHVTRLAPGKISEVAANALPKHFLAGRMICGNDPIWVTAPGTGFAY